MSQCVIRFLRGIIFHVYALFHKVKNQILFLSFNGKSYSDNPRAISEKFHELYPNYDIVWYINTDSLEMVPNYVRLVTGRWLKFLKELSVSKCFVTNTEMHSGIFKRREQYFVQTWHGDIAFKKVLNDVIKNKKNCCYDYKYTDCAIAGSNIGVKVYRESFRYNGKIFESGMPRNDCLIGSYRSKDKIKSSLKLDDKSKILLYAPTFRDSNTERQKMNLNISEVLNLLGNDWICLLRFHPNVLKYSEKEDSRIINVSKYADMSDLLLISDFLITDYSSCAGDFLLKKMPIVLYQNDRKEYISNDRELCFDAKEKGFFVADNEEELLKIITKKSGVDYKKNCEKLLNSFKVKVNDHSSEDVCNLIYINIIKQK